MARMTAWQVIAPGLLTTVQDQGRTGFLDIGIARAGALDTAAAWLANQLVGNDADAAVLELTLRGPTLRLDAPATIALTGAAVQARFDGLALPMQRPLQLPAGTLELGGLTQGVRGYLAVRGGFAVTQVMCSRSTDLRGGFGGLAGRALQQGDALPLHVAAEANVTTPNWPGWWVGPEAVVGAPGAPIRYVPASHAAATQLTGQAWQASPRSDRQGLRLQGHALEVEAKQSLSEPVAPGTIQLPPDGQPIVLLADAQTVGGYARLGYVIAADLPRLAQVAPGQRVAFEAVRLSQAHAAACAQRARMNRIALALRARTS
ncbi:MAG: biotin-dependent carboxyltransferase family protein [Pseudoxanthomonas sp.]